MKKVTSFILLLMILASLLPSAMAAPGDAVLFTEDQRKELGIEMYYTPSIAVVGDTVYTLWGTEIYAWQLGQETPVKVSSNLEASFYSTYEDAKAQLGDKADTLISSLVGSNDTVYGLNRLTGKLFPLTFDQGKVVFGSPISLDWTSMEVAMDSYTYVKEAYRMSIYDNKLYALIRNDEDYYKPEIASFDLSTGAKQVLNIPFGQDITPYKDGKLLVKVYDMENAYADGGAEPAKPTMAIYNPADGSVTQAGIFGDANVFGIVYQPESDTLFYTTNSKLMGMKALGSASQVAYIPVDYADDCTAVILPGGLYAINTWNGLFVRNTDPQYIPTSTLSVYGGYMDKAAMTFSVKYPQVPVVFNQNVYFDSVESLAQAMVSGDSAFDIYNIDISYQDFQGLMEKGYTTDLGASPILTAEMEKLYPFLHNAVQMDGKFFALPVSMYSYGLSYSTKAWEAEGLTDRLPTSFMGFIDFFDWWIEDGMTQHPNIELMQDVMDYGETLFQMAISQYVYYCQATGQDLSFNTPMLRNMMQALEELDIKALNDTLPSSMDGENYTMYSASEDNYLFMNYGDWLGVYSRQYDYSTPLILSIEDGGPRHIPTYVQAMFINPNTKNMEMALKYVENALENMEQSQHVMMFPDDNEPVPTENYEKMIQSWEEELDKAKKRLETAKPEEKKDIESLIQNYQDIIARKDEFYWNISPDSIAKYRELATLCYAATPNLLNYRTKDGTSEIGTLIDRYRQKQMSLDQFVVEADKKIRMILLERQ